MDANRGAGHDYAGADDKTNIAKVAGPPFGVAENLIEFHSFNSNDEAISSVAGSGEYTSGSFVRDPDENGETTAIFAAGKDGDLTNTYTLRNVGGKPRVVRSTSSCAGCGGINETIAYNAKGQITRRQDGRGYITETMFDTEGRVQSVTEGLTPAGCTPSDGDDCRLDADDIQTDPLGTTPEAVTSTYQYADATWIYRPTRISRTANVQDANSPGEEQTTTDIQYDNLTGRVVSQSVTGTTDRGAGWVSETRINTTELYTSGVGQTTPFNPSPGGVWAAWNSAWDTMQPPRFVKQANGPRPADAAWPLGDDLTQFVYYPLDGSVKAANRGRLAVVRDAAGHFTRFEDYDLYGNARTVIDPNGVVRLRDWNAWNQLLTDTVAAQGSGCDQAMDPLCDQPVTTAYTYFPGGGPLRTVTDPNGNVTEYVYDGRGRTTEIKRGPSMNTYYERIFRMYDDSTGQLRLEELQFDNALDANGNQQGPGNGPGHGQGQGLAQFPIPGVAAPANYYDWTVLKSTVYDLDDFGRVGSVVNGEGGRRIYTYNANHDVIAVLDENHQGDTVPNVRYTLDSRGRVVQVSQLENKTPDHWVSTSFAYAADSQVASVTDANGNVTCYTVDDFGQVVQVDSPVTGTTYNRFDRASNLISTTDARGITLTRAFDELGRLTSEIPSSPGAPVITWTYDQSSALHGIGRVTGIQDQLGTYTFDYDRRGLPVKQTTFVDNIGDLVTGLGLTQESRQEYDRAGNATAMIYPSGLRAETSYDFANRPVGLSVLRAGETATTPIVEGAHYAPFGPPLWVRYANGFVDDRSYYADLSLKRHGIYRQDGGAPIHWQRFARDGVRNITEIYSQDSQGQEILTHAYVYDDLYRLRTAAGPFGTFTYDLDDLGNREQVVHVKPDATVRTVDYTNRLNAGGKADSVLEDWTDGVTTRTYAVDARGDVVSDGQTSYLYDDWGRMSYEYTQSYDRQHYYDYAGRRIVHSGAGSNGTRIFGITSYWMGMQIGEERAVIPGGPDLPCPVRPCPPPQEDAEGSMSRIYFGGQPIAQVFSDNLHNGDLRFLFTDHLGTVIASADQTGEVTWQAEYEPFGKVASTLVGDASTDPGIRFPGQELDDILFKEPNDLTPLHYNTFRWYDPETGRYLTPDPMGLLWGQNLYQYARSNPINMYDATGAAPRAETRGSKGDPGKRAEFQKFYDSVISTASRIAANKLRDCKLLGKCGIGVLNEHKAIGEVRLANQDEIQKIISQLVQILDNTIYFQDPDYSPGPDALASPSSQVPKGTYGVDMVDEVWIGIMPDQRAPWIFSQGELVNLMIHEAVHNAGWGEQAAYGIGDLCSGVPSDAINTKYGGQMYPIPWGTQYRNKP